MINTFKYIKIRLASPQIIKNWSSKLIYLFKVVLEEENNKEKKDDIFLRIKLQKKLFKEKLIREKLLKEYQLLDYKYQIDMKILMELQTNKIFVEPLEIGLISNENLFVKDDKGNETKNPEPNGIFSTLIFGPLKDFTCDCNKTYLLNFDNIDKYCTSCGVEINYSFIRRYRLGYIDLSIPLIHTWYFFGTPNYLSLISNISLEILDKYIYHELSSKNINFFGSLINKELDKKKLIFELKTFLNLEEDSEFCKILINCINLKLMPNEIFYELLSEINLEKEIENERIKLIENIEKESNIFYLIKVVRRIKILESFFLSRSRPEWIFLTRLVVSPAGLRHLDSNNLEDVEINSDINYLYQKIIRLSNKIGQVNRVYDSFLALLALSRSLQENIDFIIDESKIEKETNLNKRPISSFSSLLEGKFGKFRQQILGKRVNYSGRTVISVNPQLRLNQCAIPYAMARVIYDPFLKKALKYILKRYKKDLEREKNPIDYNYNQYHLIQKTNNLFKYNKEIKHYNINELDKLENFFLKNDSILIFELLYFILKNKIIFLNRAPTLHRLGIEAFEPILVSSKTIQIHPLVCSSYNADFDGDQMSLQIPITNLANLELRNLLLSNKTLLSPSNNGVQLKPSQDIVIGLYYLTLKNEFCNPYLKGLYFNSFNEVISFYFSKKITINSPIWLKLSLFENNCDIKNKNLLKTKTNKVFVRTTIGRIIFNQVLKNNILNFKYEK